MVFYRKYRPQLISELDLTQVREKLTAVLKAREIAHAFLFAGPKGLGKTSSARILGKAINCLAKQDSASRDENKKKGSVEPCNVCSACISITNGSAVDVIEIDAASNRGIDEIRELKERIKFSPSSLKKKVYIIDEVHMLTTEAFNALLKTLEEPPDHVVFILATTEIGKLPETILSRVFLVQFEKPSKEEIARSLGRVARGEDLEIEENVMAKIGELSDGAFRDGAKILEELSLNAIGKKIDLTLLESLYKTGSIENSVKELIQCVLNKDMKKALDIINNLGSQNTDFKLVIEKMADELHGRLLDFVSMNKTNEIISTQKFLELLDEAYKDLRGAVLPQLPLEIAVLEYSLEKQGPQLLVHSSQSNANIQDKTEKAEKQNTMNSVLPAGRDERTLEYSSPRITNNQSLRAEALNNPDLFKQLINSINLENKILAGLLRGCKIEDSPEGTFIIKAPSDFHLKKLSERQNGLIIETHIRKLLQKEVALQIKN